MYEINKANLKLSRKIAVIPIDKSMDKDSWLNDILKDLALESLRDEYPHVHYFSKC